MICIASDPVNYMEKRELAREKNAVTTFVQANGAQHEMAISNYWSGRHN